MSEEKTVYDFLMEARREVAERLDGTYLRSVVEQIHRDTHDALAAVPVEEPREVEYEWCVLSEKPEPSTSDVFETEAEAREVAERWRKNGLRDATPYRRPVGEWERVDG